MTAYERPAVNLTWHDLRYTVQVPGDNGKGTKPKELLKGVSGTARQSRTLAVMGPSGAGKSTFLNGISGRLAINAQQVLTGTAYLNDVVFLSRYKQLISYVAQDDIVMGKDTPREALTFSYRMRSGASSAEAETVVNDMLKKLTLEGCAETLLGLPGLLKGVSGGEKKRTNIGSELINNPMILLLDEPTTGLDSVNALRVGNLLRDLAHDENRTVICTIHTPSSELYDVFDDILLLAKGHVIYHGPCKAAPAYFTTLGHPVPARMNPSEHFMKLLQLDGEDLQNLVEGWKAYAASDAAKENGSINQTPTNVRMNDEAFDKLTAKKQISMVGEFGLLLGRAWRMVVRDPGSTIGRLVQTLFFAVLLALFFANLSNDDAGVQDRSGVLFMAVMNLVFMNVMNAIAVFPPERAVFLQEQTNAMYSAPLYYMAKVIADTPLILFFPVLYNVITYFSWDLALTPEAFFTHFGISLVISYTGNAFGLFVASLFPRPEITMTVTPLMIMPMMLVGGLFANTERLEPYWYWLNYISFPRYCYKAFMINEFENTPTLSNGRFATGREVLKFYGFDGGVENTVWFNVVLLLAMMVVLRIIGMFGLWLQGYMRRSELVFEGNYRKLNGKSSDAIEMRQPDH